MKYLLGATGVLMIMAACGGATTATGETAVPDPHDLPDTVDVKTAAAVQGLNNVLILDVREPWEYDRVRIPGVTLIPMGDVASRLHEIPTDKEVIVACRSGNRSGQVVDFLREQGYDNVHNMAGGILAWQEAGLPVEQ